MQGDAADSTRSHSDHKKDRSTFVLLFFIFRLVRGTGVEQAVPRNFWNENFEGKKAPAERF